MNAFPRVHLCHQKRLCFCEQFIQLIRGLKVVRSVLWLNHGKTSGEITEEMLMKHQRRGFIDNASEMNIKPDKDGQRTLMKGEDN